MSDIRERVRRRLFESRPTKHESFIDERVREITGKTSIRRCLTCPRISICHKEPGDCDRS